MGWQFAARWVDDPDRAWEWAWQRVADDSGAVLEESKGFSRLEDCIQDAQYHGFDESSCPPE
jgi:hypothetical protein